MTATPRQVAVAQLVACIVHGATDLERQAESVKCDAPQESEFAAKVAKAWIDVAQKLYDAHGGGADGFARIVSIGRGSS